MKNYCYLCDKQVEVEELEVGQYPICDECVKRMEGEDKLEPAQKEHNFPKYDLDADFWRNRWCEASAEALQQQLEFIKLEKKLATAVKALTEITNNSSLSTKVKNIASEALAEIGG